MLRSELMFLATWSILSLSKQSSEWYDSGVEREPITWAVDVSTSRPWWSHWLMLGAISDDELSVRAEAIAAHFHLINKGPAPGFRTIFKFELPVSNLYRNTTSSDLRLKRDEEEPVINNIDAELAAHPSVAWAGRQIPLTRTKRLFNDPKFNAQWHLVCTVYLVMQISLNE